MAMTGLGFSAMRRSIAAPCALSLGIAWFCLAAPAASQIPSQAHKLMPGDDAAKDPSFFTFRSQLMQALLREDTTYLYSILAEDIKNSIGGADGIAGFKRTWGLDRADSASQSLIWEMLTRVLSLGGRLRGDVFQAPYISALWPEAIDPFEFVAILGDKVSVRATPDADAPLVEALSFDIVGFKEWEGLGPKANVTANSWAQIELGDGRTGWVHGRFAYGPTGWRAYFVKRSGRWVLTQFAAGD